MHQVGIDVNTAHLVDMLENILLGDDAQEAPTAKQHVRKSERQVSVE